MIPRLQIVARLVAVAVALHACMLATPARAQTVVYLDAGGAHVRYGDSTGINTGTVSANVNAVAPSTSFSALVAGSATGQSAWTLFGAANGSAFTSARRFLRGEVHGSGSGTTYGSSTGSAHLVGGARVHLSLASRGAWAGLSAGSVMDEVGWRSLRAAEAGIWTQLGSVLAQAIVMPVRIADGLSYTDTEATIRFASARLELGAAVGFRAGLAAIEGSRNAWGSVSSTAWVARGFGITGSVGHYPADPGQGLPAAAYATLGLRYAPHRPRAVSRVYPADVLVAEARARAPAMTVAGSGANRTIVFRSTAGQRVELMGDFTDWTPTEMTRSAAGTWSIALPLAAGVHQVNVRVDGGAWIVPEGLTSVKDEFGGSVGILLVP